MKALAFAVLAAATLTIAGAAAAATKVSDVDYIEASRCKGIASAIGADTSGLDAFVKAESVVRADYILQKGEAEAARAKREAKDSLMRERLSAELSGACTAYMGAGKAMAGR